MKIVYDAGLRPWRVNPALEFTLHVTDEEISVVAPTGKTFKLPVEIASFSVLEGNQIGHADFIAPPMSMAGALEKAQQICSALGVPQDGLVEAALSFEKLKGQAPTLSWNGRERSNKSRYSVTLTSLVISDLGRVYGKVDTTLDFSDHSKPPRFLTEPIKQPAGYEQVSMAPPTPDPRKGPFPGLKYDPDEMRKRMDRAIAKSSASSSPSIEKTADAISPVPVSLGPKAILEFGAIRTAESFPAWTWYVVGFVLLCTASIMVIQRLKK